MRISRRLPFLSDIKDRFVANLSRFQFSQEPVLLIFAAVTGILGGFGGIIFYKMIQFVEYVFFQFPGKLFSVGNLADLLGFWRYIVIPIIPALGGLLVGWVTTKFSPGASGEGVPMVIESVAVKGARMNPLLSVTTLVTSALSIGTGGAGGREGPVIQIGGAIGSGVGQLFNLNESQLKYLVGCGAAAGLAAVFNAPIGGALFAMEVVLGSITVQSFSPIIISSVFGTFVSRSIIGNRPVFQIPTFSMVSGFELVVYLALGILAGFVAVAFIKSFYWIDEFFERPRFFIRSKVLKPAFGGLLVGVIGIFLPQVFGYTYQGVTASLYDQASLFILVSLLVMKIIATSVTLGSGGSGGTLAPSLFIGAMAGGALGVCANMLFPSVTAPAGAYALVGMAAVTGATTHAPLASAILVFEMTDKYEIILPLLLAVVISTFVSRRYLDGSIYTLRLKMKGEFLDVYGRDIRILRTIKVKDVMRAQIVAASESTRLSDLIEMIPETNTAVFPIIRHDGTLSGTISYGEIRQALTDKEVKNLLDVLVVKDILVPTKLSVTQNEDLSFALKLMIDAGVPSVPVVREGNQLMGMLFLNDATQAYDKKLLMSEVSTESDKR